MTRTTSCICSASKTRSTVETRRRHDEDVIRLVFDSTYRYSPRNGNCPWKKNKKQHQRSLIHILLSKATQLYASIF